MRTLQPVLKIGRNCWNRENMPETEFRARVRRLRKIMAKYDVDILLLYGNGVNNYGHQSYISNYVPESVGGVIVFIPAEGKVTLVFEGVARGLSEVKNITWIEDIRASGDIIKSCIEYLEAGTYTSPKVGIAGFRHLMPALQWHKFYQLTGRYSVRDFSDAIQEMRMIKSSRERAQIKRTSGIVSRAFDILTKARFSTITEQAIQAETEKYCYSEGADDVRCLITNPQEKNGIFRPAENNRIVDSKTIAVYLAVACETYWAESIRTYIVNPPSLIPPQAKVELTPILKNLNAGIPISKFYELAVNDLKSERESSFYNYPGNSIGLGLQEYPVISESENLKLKKGMCLALRTVTRNNGFGNIITGNTVLLEKEGPEIPTRSSSDNII